MKKKRWLSILLSLTLILSLMPVQVFAEEGTVATETACTQTADCPAGVHEPGCPLWQEDGTGPDEIVLDETLPDAAGMDSTEPDGTLSGETESEEDSTRPEGTASDEDHAGAPEESDGPETVKPPADTTAEPSADTTAEPLADTAAEPSAAISAGAPESEVTDNKTALTAADEVLALIEALPDPGSVTAENAEALEVQLRELLSLYQALDEDGQEEVGDTILPAIQLQAALDALSGEDNSPALLATTTDVEYMEAAYDETTGEVTYTPKTITETVTVVDDNSLNSVALADGWYVVKGMIRWELNIYVQANADVHLILADDCELTAGRSILVPENSSLTIYGQENGTGTLTANPDGIGNYVGGIEGTAGIGGGGTVTIHGGTVNAIGGTEGAGIGGSKGVGGAVTIYGGTVNATGGFYGAGIGGSKGVGGAVTIYGGTVNAIGGTEGAGIGGGEDGTGIVTIYGGVVNATGGNRGAGIGSGEDGTGIVTIYGGTVNATGSYEGAGIGGGKNGTGTVIICGGTVNAIGGTVNGSYEGAGIGGEDSSTVTICGGTVTVIGKDGNGITASGTFSTTAADGTPGTAFIVASSIGDESDKTSWSGVILTGAAYDRTTKTVTGGTGQVYGEDVTLTTDATVPEDAALTIPAGSTLVVASGTTLTNEGNITNNGAIYVEPEATFVEGKITGNGILKTNVVPVRYEAYEDGQFVTRKVYDYTVVNDQIAWGTANTETWYVVNTAAANNLTISDRITVTGDVHLILADGCTLTASKGIGVNTASNSLTIYGQTAGTGELTTGTPDDYYAGIGGDNSKSSGAITINGGTVKATGGYQGAGIGSGHNSNSSAIIAIHGGVVTATGGSDGAGIGSSYGISSSSSITISGGTVNATGGSNSAGIGGGLKATGTVTINGGTVNATGSSNSAGIGGGMWGTVNVTINGGTVNATAGYLAAGIGNGVPNRGQTNTGTVTINGGFVAATGGLYSPAIGIGGNAQNAGVETDTSNFNNAVVLKQSGASGSTMTGQVYGDPTLDTNAEVPAGATLTIPEGTSLTIVSGTTLTNSGAIYQEGGSLLYGDSYGTLTNDGDGKLYYLLTVNGGSATAGTAIYDGKTYAEQSAAVTLTAEDKVGLTFDGSWTASPTSASVTFSKVDGANETAGSYQFTMPAQVLTVTAGYKNTPTYTVTIPASVTIGEGASTAAIKAESVNVAEGWRLNVTLTATSGADNAFTLALKDHANVTLGYTMTLTKTTVKLGEDGTETTDTSDSGTTVSVSDNPTVLTIPGGTANSSGSAELTFAMASGQLMKYSGTYAGTVTFTVSVTEDTATDSDGGNIGDGTGGSDVEITP